MEKTVIKVEGMSCGHCAKAIEEAVGALDGVAAVTVGLENKTAAVDYDPARCALAQIKAEIEEQGFEVAE
jgi:copper chaperone